MRIAVDVRSLMEGKHSGVEEYTIQIIRAMIRVAPQHSYHLFYNSAKPVKLPNFGEGRVVIHGRRFPNKLLNSLQWLLSWPKWDKLIAGAGPASPDFPRPTASRNAVGARRGTPQASHPRNSLADVFFVPNPRLLPLSVDTPFVVVMHDLSFELFPEFLNLRRRAWHRLMRPKQLANNADKIIAVSQRTKQDLIDLYGIAPEKIAAIHSGVSLPQAPRAAHVEQLRRKLPLPQRFVLYLGTLEPRKNVASIVRAWSAIAPYAEQDLVIAGERGWREKEVEQAIAASVHKNRIHRLGFIEEDDKPALYAAADLFVYPSFYEGFGFPPLESMLAGTPVITSFNSSLPEIVGQWATMIDPYNPSQIAGVMREMLANPQRVPDSVRKKIQEIYSWDKTARETIKILESVV